MSNPDNMYTAEIREEENWILQIPVAERTNYQKERLRELQSELAYRFRL